jgi:hypothetical protein
MAGVTVWPARRVGNRILCGRPAPDGGCRGEIARALPGGRAGELQAPPPGGFVESPPGSGNWEPGRTATDKMATGRAPTYRRKARTNVGVVHVRRQPTYPWRRRCPTCGVTAEVSADLL